MLLNYELIIGIAALVLSSIGIFASIRSLIIQRKHNYMSLKPICRIKVGDYESNIFVKLSNTGVGPLIIKRVAISYCNKVKSNLIDFCPTVPEGLDWNDFVKEIKGKVIRVNEDLVLIDIEGLDKRRNTQKEAADFGEFITKLRNILSEVTINVEYTDIYEKNYFKEMRKLSWFNRK